MVMFYATQSKIQHLWGDVTVILWGAPVKFITENKIIQQEMEIAMHAGVKFSACTSCARKFGVVDELEKLGIKLHHGQSLLQIWLKMAKPLSMRRF